MKFKISKFPPLEEQLRALARRAAALGISQSFSEAIKRINKRLQHDPLGWAIRISISDSLAPSCFMESRNRCSCDSQCMRPRASCAFSASSRCPTLRSLDPELERAAAMSLRRFLSRRWLFGLLAGAVVLFGLAMLHPYPRQSLFGPKIDGVPWCVWENEIRVSALQGRARPWFYMMLEKIGLLDTSSIKTSEIRPQLLPIYLHLTEDSDPEVRRYVLSRLERRNLREELWRWSPDDEKMILPIIRQRLDDDDPICRLLAAEYLWNATNDRAMIKVPLGLLGHPDPLVHRAACIILCYLAPADPEAAFSPVTALCWDNAMKKDVRLTAVQSLRHFGNAGIPTIRKALKDPDRDISLAALYASAEIGSGAKELVPTIFVMQENGDRIIRYRAAITLNKIDAKKFPEPPRLDP
ncbi:MAG: HEAT repeat domain-containing protein [Planctomycetes bacterium]|nr:HEAT repeat domain-containing protein [Planctomycetota bacterium]